MESNRAPGNAKEETLAAQKLAWEAVRARFSGYALLMPGDPQFVCLATECPAHCCRKYSVSLGAHEVDRMVAASGLQPVYFLESEDGEPIALPLAQPFLLAREDGACKLLGDQLLCGQYEGRPDACRQYPHHVLFIDTEHAKPVYGDLERMAEAMAWFDKGTHSESRCVPILVRHLDCPGFDGPPLPTSDWLDLVHETTYLQYAQLRPHIAAFAGVLDLPWPGGYSPPWKSHPSPPPGAT